MKNVTSASKLWRDREGASFLEFTFVFPLLMLTAFCTVDFALVMFDWAQANKATQRGARVAIVSAPVAGGLDDLSELWVEDLGLWCVDADGIDTGNCPAVQTVCNTSAAPNSCVDDFYPFITAAFTTIFDEMQRVFPRLEPQNVQISYRTMGLGFVGRPGGLPMEVTIEIRCMTHQVFFLAALAQWAFEPRDGCPNDSGVPIPAFATTLTTESLGT